MGRSSESSSSSGSDTSNSSDLDEDCIRKERTGKKKSQQVKRCHDQDSSSDSSDPDTSIQKKRKVMSSVIVKQTNRKDDEQDNRSKSYKSAKKERNSKHHKDYSNDDNDDDDKYDDAVGEQRNRYKEKKEYRKRKERHNEDISDNDVKRNRRSNEDTNSSEKVEKSKMEKKRNGANSHVDEAGVGSEKKSCEKETENYELSGKLTEYTNTYNGVVIIYNEPPEARKPKTKWRFYPFKGEKALTMLQLHRQSAFLLGRDRKVADIPVDHPSCSKQHAVLQFRLVQYEKDDGEMGKKVKPYIIDLDSRNGTHVNNKKIEPRKYVELLERDVVKFGFSSRDYVLLHEKSETIDSAEDEGEN